MNFYNDDVVRSEAAQRRTRLLHEAAQHRQHRQHRRTQPTQADRLLAAFGDRLVTWGERLRQRRTAWHATLAAQAAQATPGSGSERELAC